MSNRPVIWITEPIHADALDKLGAVTEILGPGPLPEARSDEVQAIIVRANMIDRTLCDRLPALRVVGKHGAGTDNIDLPLMAERGVEVFKTEGANAESVADLAVLHAMTLLRSPHRHDQALRKGRNGDDGVRVGYELSERRAGILGVGAIGRAVAKRLSDGFGAQVHGYDPVLPEHLWPETIVRKTDFDAFLAETDLLFLHLPLTPETHHLIDARALDQLCPGAFVVNCARGGIVDEAALAKAMRSGQIAGAASDVFESEPPPPDALLFADDLNFIGTPHIGASTQAGLRRTGMMIADKVLNALLLEKEVEL